MIQMRFFFSFPTRLLDSEKKSPHWVRFPGTYSHETAVMVFAQIRLDLSGFVSQPTWQEQRWLRVKRSFMITDGHEFATS